MGGIERFFDSERNAREYIAMAADYDDCGLINVLRRHLPDGSEVLELGMGPGKDLEVLGQHFRAVGTDASQSFLDIYLASHPNADVFLLDAVIMNTNRQFDAIYSNKVLIHLTRAELKQSLAAQAGVLRPDGIAVHSFWYGETEEEHNALRFTYHTEESIREAVAAMGPGASGFEIIETIRYTEMEANDSLAVVLRRT
jgi:SAM-dependent methyltransferase